MKKHIIKGAAALALCLSLSSCDDFLTEDVHGSQNLDTFFANEEEVNTFIGGCYFEIAKDDWWQIYNAWLQADMTTDDLWDGNSTQSDGYQDVTYFMPTAPQNGALSNFWGARYQGIYTCNTAIKRIPGAAMNETLRAQRVAEARFLRAFFYFDLARFFGGVPLITEPISNGEGIGRNTLDEVYDFVEKELAEVAEVLPQRSQWGAADMGRATRGAALGLLGKVQVYHGKYADAKVSLKKVIDEGEYELLPNFGDVWSVPFNNSKESLFEVQTMYSNQYSLGSVLTVITGCRNGVGDGWAWGTPTSDLENAYIAAGDTERLRWTIIKTGCKEIPGESNFAAFIDNNAQVFTAGGINDAKFQNYKKEFGWGNDVYEESYVIDPAQHKSARIIRKYFVPLEYRGEVYDKGKIPLNHRILRYADVLLLYAEACNETNDDVNARLALNEVRERVNLAPVTSSGTALRDAIRLERRLELAYEQNRLFDIRRWDAGNGKKVMETIMGPNGSFVTYNLGPNADMYEVYNQGQSSDKGTRFTAPRDLLYPIPSEEIQRSNGALVQNEGY